MPKYSLEVDGKTVELTVEEAFARPDGVIKKTNDRFYTPVRRLVSQWFYPPTKDDLKGLTKKELLAIAVEMKLEGRSALSKAQLIEALT